jgi:hypothetical protein
VRKTSEFHENETVLAVNRWDPQSNSVLRNTVDTQCASADISLDVPSHFLSK